MHTLAMIFAVPTVILIAVLLIGCSTTGTPPPCHTCVGPYDLGLSSHREALGLRP